MTEFDFEKDVERVLPKITDDTIHSEIGSFKVGDQKHRVIVCRHWLLGLCFNGIHCSYLHKLDKNKMPPCKHGKQCKIKNCPLKHVADEELEECVFYRQGFCYNGPKCGRRHVKRTPEQCPVEAVFEVISASQAQTGKKLKTGQPNDNYKVTLCTHWLLNNNCPFGDECHYAHGEDDINEGFQPNAEFLYDADIHDPTRGRMEPSLELPVPQSSRCSFFILQAPDLRSLTISRRRGVWAAPSRLIGEMNAAYRSCDHVIIYFSVRPLRGIYGVARLGGPIPSGSSPLSPEFPVQWLRTMRISLRTVAQLKLGSSGMFVGRSSTDGRFENRAGLDMLFTAYRKPIWDWSREIELAEKNIRLSDISTHGNATGEYFPAARAVPYFLHPDVLFAEDWVERAGWAVNEKGVLLTAVPGHARHVPTDGLAALENYTGLHPAFIVCGGPAEIEEMLGRMLCGLPADFQDKEAIPPNMPIFLFDVQMQVMLGIFFTTAKAVMNMDPSAFQGWAGAQAGGGGRRGGQSMLPYQFPIRPALDCPPVVVPIHDPELYSALGEYAQTLGRIGLPHTKSLIKLFLRKAKTNFPGVQPFSMMAGGGGGGGGRGGGRGGHRGGGGGGHTNNASVMNSISSFYRPPFRCVEAVPVDIDPSTPNFFEIRKRLLGNNASALMAIVDAVGSKNSIRIRLRGQGSGFYEGPSQQELPEPLHFNVSAENEDLLHGTVSKLRDHIQRIRSEHNC